MNSPDKHRATLLSVTSLIVTEHPEIIAMVVELQRKHLARRVFNHFGGLVAYGPFKGLRLSPEAHWGNDHGAMALGLYEQEVMRELVEATQQRKVLVNLGAGDGYYAIGALVSGMSRKAYGFEMSEKGREMIAAGADANHVRDRIEILGEAARDFFERIDAAERDEAVLLVDIEGAEFEVLTPSTFRAFAKAVIIVEIHEWIENAGEKIARLRQDAAATHEVRSFTMGARDLSGLAELTTLGDTERWLLCSEGRPRLMSWLRFDPR